MSADAMIEGLQQRGFDPWLSVRVGDSGPRKILVIKEVRALTGLGLKDAKDAVEQGLVLFDGLTPADAAEVATQLETAGASANIELSRAHRYAFRPRDPRRGDQACERLSVVGRELVLEHGHIGAWTRAQVLCDGRGESTNELFEAIDGQRARWTEAGLHEAGSELELVVQLSARDERLEAQVEAAEGDALLRAAAVYGDWLQGQGDPRGLVAALALDLAEARDDPARASRAAALTRAVSEHAAHLLGPAQGLLEHTDLTWSGPLVTGVELPRGALPDGLDCSGLLGHLLALPICAGLRRVKVASRFAAHPTLAELLVRASCAASLRALVVADARRFACGAARLERLEQLDITAVELELRGLVAPRLQRLRVELRFPPNDLAAAFSGLDAPLLQEFEFATATYDYWDQHREPIQTHLRRLFEQPSFAGLRSLTLRSLEGSLPYHNGLHDVLLHMPAIASLERIDLRQAKLGQAGRAELEEARARLPGLLL